VCAEYDHVLLTREPDLLSLPDCLEVQEKHPHFWLLKVKSTPHRTP
jgi:hypothetical protein